MPAALQTALILSALADSDVDGVSVRAVATEVGASRSATHRVLQTLSESGFAVQDRHGRYSVGPRLVQLAARVMSGSSVIGAADEIMRRLVAEVNETAYLALFMPSQLEATFVHRAECSQPLRYVQPIGTRIPLHAGAAGKAILAVLSDVDPEALELRRYTDSTITTHSRLLTELEQIREKGFATSMSERVEGAAGIAAPVVGHDGSVASLTITVPTSRLPADGPRELGPTVARYARELSGVLTREGLDGF